MKRWAGAIAWSTLFCGCGYTGFEQVHRLSDEDLASLVDKAPYPEITPTSEAVPPSQMEVRPDGTRAIKLTLAEALRLAERNNQSFLASSEALDIQLLSLAVVRRGWWPFPQDVTGSLTYAHSPDSGSSGSESITAGITQKLPFGGSAAVSWTQSGSQIQGADSYGRSAAASMTVPILKGSGLRVAAEELVSAERDYVYANRSYAFARQELLVQTVQSFFSQLRQEKDIENQQRNLERAQTLLRQSELLFRLGRVSRTDVFRAQVQVTNAQNGLFIAREQMKLSRDAFKIDLGLRPQDVLELVDEKIEYAPLTLDLPAATADALKNNPDWLNAKNRFEDSGRALDVARSSVWPQFDVTTSYSWSQEPTAQPFDEFATGARSFSVAGFFSIPLDRLALNRDYQTAVITFRQAERALERTRDAIVRETQSRFIQLQQAEATMNFQKRAIGEAERTVRLIEFEYQRARVRNREVIDAQVQLLGAQNQYESALVAAKISQLRLLQWVGRLVIDDQGNWLK